MKTITLQICYCFGGHHLLSNWSFASCYFIWVWSIKHTMHFKWYKVLAAVHFCWHFFATNKAATCSILVEIYLYKFVISSCKSFNYCLEIVCCSSTNVADFFSRSTISVGMISKNIMLKNEPTWENKEIGARINISTQISRRSDPSVIGSMSWLHSGSQLS